MNQDKLEKIIEERPKGQTYIVTIQRIGTEYILKITILLNEQILHNDSINLLNRFLDIKCFICKELYNFHLKEFGADVEFRIRFIEPHKLLEKLSIT